MVFFEQHGMEEKESFHHFTVTNQTFPLHFHRAYELIIVNEGSLQVSIDQKEYFLNKNDIAFVFSNQMHEFKTLHKSKITIVIFSPELIGHFFMNYKGYIPENNVFQLSHLPDFDTLHSIYHQKSFLYSICSKLVENTDFIPVQHTTKTRILHKVLLLIDKNYSEECTLKLIAKELQYDYAYLSKLFVQVTNMTFTEYVNHYRIYQACYLLKNSQKSIGDIAINCGYNNLRSFNRYFKNIMSISPSKYRGLMN